MNEMQTVEITPQDLYDAARTYDVRGDEYRANACADLGEKLARFGSFVSEKQEAFANRLVAESKDEPKPKAVAPKVLPDAYAVTRLFEVMQKHAQFFVGPVTLTRRNQDSLVWIKHESHEKVIGTIDGGWAKVFARAGDDKSPTLALLNELNNDPLGAAQKYGRLSGRCCSCGRDLTNPESIAAGIGPVCAEKFQ